MRKTDVTITSTQLAKEYTQFLILNNFDSRDYPFVKWLIENKFLPEYRISQITAETNQAINNILTDSGLMTPDS